jgi:hypothetical protein
MLTFLTHKTAQKKKTIISASFVYQTISFFFFFLSFSADYPIPAGFADQVGPFLMSTAEQGTKENNTEREQDKHES